MMRGHYRQPINEDAFEDFCLELLREHWSLPTLQRYGHRGERQDGVDLYDTGGASPFRAVQCKHHEPTKTLPPKEVQDEVDKAKEFPEAIDAFFIITSAKKSTRAQQKVREINKDHLARGLFTVELLTWSDVESIIDNCPTAQALLGVQAPQAQRRLLREELKPLHDDIKARSDDALGYELDEIKSHLDAAQTDIAELRLDKMRSRSWDKLSNRSRFRWCTLRGDCYFRKGRNTEAARSLLEAKSHQPEEEKAIVNEISAYALLGDLVTAHSLAQTANSAAPHSAPIYAALISTATSDEAALRLFEARPQPIADHPDVWAAAVARTESSPHAEVELMVRQAVKNAPDDPRSWFALASLLLRSELEKVDPGTPPAAAGVVRSRVEEAADSCSKVLKLGEGGNPRMLVAARLRRATALGFLGHQEAWEEDVREARRLAPTEPQVLIAFARMEEEQGRFDAAVEALRQLVMRNSDDEGRFYLALTLWNRNGPEDRTEAVELLKALPLSDLNHRETVAEVLVEGLLLQKRPDDAREWIGEAESMLEPCLVATLFARVEAAVSNQEAQSKHVAAALDAITDTTPKATLRKLVKILLDAARQADAFGVLERLVFPGEADDDVRQFASVAGQLGRDNKVLELCSAARAQGTMDPFLVRWEVGLLDRYDPAAALELLLEFLPHDSFPYRTRLHIAYLALRLGKIDVASQQVEFLPTIEQASGEEGAAVVVVLNRLQRNEEALAYAYDLLRRHFRDPHAHRAYRDAILSRGDIEPPETPQQVAAGCAVRIEEAGVSETWYVIEDSSVPAEHVENELAPDSPLASKILGKKIGDEIVLSEGPGLTRTAVVREIQSKRVFRFQDVLSRWQYRFSDLQEMWMVRLAETNDEDRLDFTPLLDMIQHQRQRITDAEEYYRQHPIPIRTLGSMLSKSELYALAHVAESPQLAIRCCQGNALEYRGAVEALKAASQVVLDITALTTLFLLNRAGVLRGLGKKILITHATRDAVRRFADEMEGRKHASGSLGARGNGHVIHEPSEEEKQAAAGSAAEFLVEVSKSCTVVGCAALAGVPPEERQLFAEVLGDSVLESGLIGAQPGTLLWSDDGVATHHLQARFGTKRIWTQAIFRWLNEEGLLPDDDYTDAGVRLMSFKYEFTSVNHSIMHEAASQAEWDASRAPLCQAVEYLALDTVDPGPIAFLAANLVADGYVETSLIEKRQALVLAVAESLGRRRTAEETVRRFVTSLGPAFGVNLVGCDDALKTFRAWLREYSRRLR